MTIWGNHSATQYPDVFHAEIDGKPAFAAVGSDQAWLEGDFIPTVQQRGAAVIKARGLSSAASAANAAIGHVRSWVLGTPEGDWVSMGVVSDGSYGTPEGIISSFPCTAKDGEYQIVQGLDIDDFSRARIDASNAELVEERNAVKRPRPDLIATGAERCGGHYLGTCWWCCRRGPCRRSGRWRSRRPCSGSTRPPAPCRRTRGQASPTRWWTCAGRSADELISSSPRSKARPSSMHTWIASASRATLVGAELGGVGEGRESARWQISLARSRPRPASRCWSRRNPWRRIGCSASSRLEGGRVDGVGVGAEAEQRGLLLGVARRPPTRRPCARSRPR